MVLLPHITVPPYHPAMNRIDVMSATVKNRMVKRCYIQNKCIIYLIDVKFMPITQGDGVHACEHVKCVEVLPNLAEKQTGIVITFVTCVFSLLNSVLLTKSCRNDTGWKHLVHSYQ